IGGKNRIPSVTAYESCRDLDDRSTPTTSAVSSPACPGHRPALRLQATTSQLPGYRRIRQNATPSPTQTEPSHSLRCLHPPRRPESPRHFLPGEGVSAPHCHCAPRPLKLSPQTQCSPARLYRHRGRATVLLLSCHSRRLRRSKA